MGKAMCTYKPFDQLIESRGLRYDFVAKKWIFVLAIYIDLDAIHYE